jgi:hypothetical protein
VGQLGQYCCPNNEIGLCGCGRRLIAGSIELKCNLSMPCDVCCYGMRQVIFMLEIVTDWTGLD